MIQVMTLAALTGTYLAYTGFKAPSTNKLCSPWEIFDYTGTRGILISKRVRLSRKYSNENALMISPIGGGKTSRFIKHNVKGITDATLVVTDPSEDIERDVARDDVPVYRLRPLDPDNSVGFDPLFNCKNSSQVRDVMETLLMNGVGEGELDEWVGMALPLLNAYAIWNFKHKKMSFTQMIDNLVTLPLEMRVSETKVNKNSLEYHMAASGDREVITELKAFMKVKSAPQTMSCIRNTLTMGLRMFRDENVKKLCAKKPFDMSVLRREKCILYIQVPERHAEYLSPLVAVFLEQMITLCLDEPEGVPIQLVLEEFCNIGKVPNMRTLIATGRRYGVSTMACIQSLAQLREVYGEGQAEILLECFKTIMITGGLKGSTKYFSDLAGKDSEGESILTETEIRRLGKNKVLIFSQNKRVVKDTMMPYFPYIKAERVGSPGSAGL